MDHKFQSLRGIARVERLIACSCLEHADSRYRHVFAARYQNRNSLIFANALAGKECGYVLGDSVNLAVGKGLVKVDHGNIVGGFLCLAAEEGHDVGDLILAVKAIELIEPLRGLFADKLNLVCVLFFAKFRYRLLIN